MALLLSSSGGGDREVLPPDNYKAICYKIADLGTRETTFENDPPRKQRRIYIWWEIMHPKMEDGRPFSVGKEYTMSLNENSNLHKDLKSWRGRSFTEEELGGFDIANILGVSCDLEIIHTSGGNMKVLSVFKPDGGAKKTPTHNECELFELEEYVKEWKGESTAKSKEMCDIFAEFPNFLQEKINESFEMKAVEQSTKVKDGLAEMAKLTAKPKEALTSNEPFPDDEIPF